MLPEYRRRGLTRVLLERALEEGQRNGARQAQIIFCIGNDAAERVYAKSGFKFRDEKRHPDFEAAAGSRASAGSREESDVPHERPKSSGAPSFDL
jgi:GNAT superfamily N-acetyltransferase